ncbi:MAG: tRNA lysidine(34) synthetase TilS [Pseudomonadota bacterium]
MAVSHLLNVFSQFIDEIDEHYDAINVAYSGGIDSTVLLHLASMYLREKGDVLQTADKKDDLESKRQKQDFQLHIQLKATHINHQLSSNAVAWSQHCAAVCKALNVPFAAYKVDVSPFLKKGVEAAARQARYGALISNAKTNEVILLGQHLDDQAETLLLQLCRGAGPSGLSAMPSHRYERGVHFYRPLLQVTREQITEYAMTQGLTWVEDESNASVDHDRNYIRHEVMTRLMDRFPSINHQISKSASLCASESIVVNEYMSALEDTIMNEHRGVSIERLQQHSRSTQASFLRYWLEQNSLIPPSRGILSEIRESMTSNNDRQPQVTIGKHIVYRFSDYLYIRTSDDLLEPFSYTFKAIPCEYATEEFLAVIEFVESDLVENESFKSVKDPVNAILVPDKSEITIVRGGEVNQKFKPYENRPHKPLKDWCKEWHLPPYKRQNIIKIFCNCTLAAIYTDKLLINRGYLNQLNEADSSLKMMFTQKPQ